MRLFKIKITDLDGLDTWACAAYRTFRIQEFLRTPDEVEAEEYGPEQARHLAGRYLAEVSAVRGVALIEVGREPAPVVVPVLDPEPIGSVVDRVFG